jgi:hypothetical protein
MTVVRPEPSGVEIQWRCGVCDDEGVISNWEDSPCDLRRRQLALAGAVIEIVIADELAATLRGLRLLDIDCETAGVRHARPRQRRCPGGQPMRNWTS